MPCGEIKVPSPKWKAQSLRRGRTASFVFAAYPLIRHRGHINSLRFRTKPMNNPKWTVKKAKKKPAAAMKPMMRITRPCCCISCSVSESVGQPDGSNKMEPPTNADVPAPTRLAIQAARQWQNKHNAPKSQTRSIEPKTIFRVEKCQPTCAAAPKEVKTPSDANNKLPTRSSRSVLELPVCIRCLTNHGRAVLQHVHFHG